MFTCIPSHTAASAAAMYPVLLAAIALLGLLAWQLFRVIRGKERMRDGALIWAIAGIALAGIVGCSVAYGLVVSGALGIPFICAPKALFAVWASWAVLLLGGLAFAVVMARSTFTGARS